MKVLTRLLILLLLIAGATRTAASQPLPAGDNPYVVRQDEELAPEEERDARTLAARFIKRLQEKDDFGPLVDEFFVSDFTDRFKQFLKEKKITDKDLKVFTRRVLLRASRSDLRRAYVAMMNFFNQNDLLRDAVMDHVASANQIEEWVELFMPEYEKLRQQLTRDVLTPRFFAVANSDPLLAALVSSFVEVGVDESADEGELRAAAISNLKRFRLLTAKLTGCAALMRDGVRRLRDEQKNLPPVSQVISKRDRDAYLIYKFWSDRLDIKAVGYRAGTRLIYARIFPFEMLMIRYGGRLRMLAVYPDFDGD